MDGVDCDLVSQIKTPFTREIRFTDKDKTCRWKTLLMKSARLLSSASLVEVIRHIYLIWGPYTKRSNICLRKGSGPISVNETFVRMPRATFLLYRFDLQGDETNKYTPFLKIFIFSTAIFFKRSFKDSSSNCTGACSASGPLKNWGLKLWYWDPKIERPVLTRASHFFDVCLCWDGSVPLEDCCRSR